MIETHTRHLFLKAADARCLALKSYYNALKWSKAVRKIEAKRLLELERQLGAANAQYEAARAELISEIERVEGVALTSEVER